MQREENRLRTLINVARPAVIPELKSSLIIETKIESNLDKDSHKDFKAEEVVKDNATQKEENINKETDGGAVTKVAKEKQASKKAVAGPLLSPSLIKQLRKEEEQEKEKEQEKKAEHTEEMEDQDEALAEKSGLVIRKRKRTSSKPAVIKVSIALTLHQIFI